MTNYWLMITDQENWLVIKEHEIYATNTKKIFENLKIYDKIVMYLIPKQICGIFVISDLYPKKITTFSNKEYKYYFNISPEIIIEPPMKIRKREKSELIDKISIFKNALHWGGVIMGKSILTISKEDYLLIESKLLKLKNLKLKK
ncbi:MAG TPA: hypothetical protein PKL04_06010 [Methanofastidiosum sp.]|nr:hypothetical protein [Methanofastidiosum sp.]